MPKRIRKKSISGTLSSDSFADIFAGFIILIIGWLLALVNKGGGITVGILLGVYFFIAAFRQLLSGEQPEVKQTEPASYKQNYNINPTTSAPITTGPTIASKLSSLQSKDLKCPNCGSSIKLMDRKCKYCNSSLFPETDLPGPKIFGEVELDQSLRILHPEKGRLDLQVKNRIYYGELWQIKQKANVPWTLTGNYYAGLGVDNGMFLLNWQNRFYLLDSNTPLSDNQITREFAEPAREFAASNQTRDVYFIFNNTRWHLDDLGRFRVELVEGLDVNGEVGTIGRFIHASHQNRILVVEDYQSGGAGQDTLWTGYQIQKSNIEL